MALWEAVVQQQGSSGVLFHSLTRPKTKYNTPWQHRFKGKNKLQVGWYLQSDGHILLSSHIYSAVGFRNWSTEEAERDPYWYLKGGRLDRGGEGSEGWVLDSSHDRAAICFQRGQNKGICLNDLRLNQDLEGRDKKERYFFASFLPHRLITKQ